MLLASAVVLVLSQLPAAACVAGGGPEREAVAVRGDAELSPAAAFASAKRRAEEHAREVWEERARRLADRQRPIWLPAPLLRLEVDRWLHALPVERALVVVDREDKEREHEFGSSWQTTLWVAEDARFAAAGEQRLAQTLRKAQKVVLAKSGGTVAFWAVLALALGWLDRLSRGYMTGRLRLVGLALGASIPAAVFLL